MSKVKSSKPQLYELLYIIPNNFTEEEAQKIHDKIKENMTQKGAKISFEEQWGKKKFTYPIKNFNHGYYNLIEFESGRENINNIDHFLKLSDEVLRHQVVGIKYPNVEKKKAAEKVAEKQKEEEEERVRQAQEKFEQEQKEASQKEQEVKAETKEAPSTPSTSSGQTGSGQEKKREEEVASQEEEPQKEETPSTGSGQEKGEKKEESKSEDKKKDKKSVDLNDLDEKLDDLLNTDDLV